MTPAIFVNAGALQANLTGFGQANAISGGLPDSLVDGNILFAFVQILGGSRTVTVGNAGWQLGDQLTNANITAAWAWRYCDHTDDIYPFFSWDGAAAYAEMQILQYSGSDSATPIGDMQKASGTSTALSIPHVTSSRDNSCALACSFTNSNEIIAAAFGFTQRAQDNRATASLLIEDMDLGASGSASNDADDTIASSHWSGFQIEILSPLPGTGSGGAALLAGL